MFYLVDELSKGVLVDAVGRIMGLRAGPGIIVQNSPSGITISLARTQDVRQTVQSQTVYDAKITAKSAINGGIRFSYTVQIGHWDMTSSPSTGGTWTNDSGSTTYSTFNEAESMNTFTSGTGGIGTGNTNVTQSDGTINGGACKLLPLAVGDYVTVKTRGSDSSGNMYYTIINKSNSSQ